MTKMLTCNPTLRLSVIASEARRSKLPQCHELVGWVGVFKHIHEQTGL